MNDSSDKLRSILRNTPYIDIQIWKDGLEFAGEGYLEELDVNTLLIIKKKLDTVIETGSTEILRSHYEDEIYP